MSTDIVMKADKLVKRYGHVTALDGCDFELRAGEILAVVGDNGAGKSSLIKALSGAVVPDTGTIELRGKTVTMSSPADARKHGIETVYQDLAMCPSLSIAENLFLGREIRRKGIVGALFRTLDHQAMRREAAEHLTSLKVGIQSITVPVESLSGGQRQAVAVARTVAWGSNVVIMDEPTAALGVRESAMVLDLIRQIRDRGTPVVLISHNIPHVFEIADRIHVQRLGRRAALTTPEESSMSDVVSLLTGAIDISSILANKKSS
jgi:fructose transport system ATP-binding protein